MNRPIHRIESIDRLRGLVMIIMALDHVRDFFSMTSFAPEDLSQSDPAYFFTRWITHFCAPVFVFLSGMSAWLHANAKGLGRKELALFLFSRGLWLVFLEVTVVTLSWQFAYGFLILQVIWAIGWSMIALAGLIFLPRLAIGFIAAAMIGGHNALDTIGIDAWWWNILHVQGFRTFQLGSLNGAFIGYPLIPWIGVMAAGYWFAPYMIAEPARRDRILIASGAAAIVAFAILRITGIYGDPGLASADAGISDHGRGPAIAWLSVLNATKYPPSLQFLLMTLGPALVIMPWLERWIGRLSDIVNVFGRVPFLFYVLHLPLIHVLARIWGRVFYDTWQFSPFAGPPPAAYEPNLVRCYIVWAVILVVLYWPCRAFMRYRRSHTQWWLSYV